MTTSNPKFQVFERFRVRNAISLGVLLLALLMIVDISLKSAGTFAEWILHPGFAPFFWYLGGIQELGPFFLVGFLIDIILYAAGIYVLLSLRHYLAWRRTRSRP